MPAKPPLPTLIASFVLPVVGTTLSGVKPLNKLTMLKIGWRMMTQKLRGKDYVSNGAALQGRMFQRAIQAGVDMRANATVERLVTGADGAVTGVVAAVDGKRVTFHARSGVLVNAGWARENGLGVGDELWLNRTETEPLNHIVGLLGDAGFGAQGRAPDDVAICLTIINILGGGLVKIEPEAQPAISVESCIAEVIIARHMAIFPQTRKSPSRPLADRGGRALGFLSQFEQSARDEG